MTAGSAPRPLFDTHVIVDWSARNEPSPVRPSKDAIWVGIARDGSPASACYHRTRAGAMKAVADLLAGEIAAGRTALCGFDFAFGYPVGVARTLCGTDSALDLWDWFASRVEDDDRNASNRFAVAECINGEYSGTGPFWGRPASWNHPGVPTKKSEREGKGHPPERRLIETRLPKAKTVWQLAYAGAVGSQVIVGLPHLAALRRDERLEGHLSVWPFESGLSVPGTPIVLAEIYPSMIDRTVKAGRAPGEILDRAQVRLLADHFAQLDRGGDLGQLFEGRGDLPEEHRTMITREEGWILGVPA